MSGEPVEDQSDLWIPLLRRLTEASPRWLVWKNVQSALTGTGDVDSVAPLQDWVMVEREFKDWAFSNGLGPVIVCPHAPFLLFLVALSDRRPEFYELDANRRKVFLGSTLFLPHDLLPLTVMDERGFRRVRPGVEGLLKLVQNGMKRNGSPDWEGMRSKGIRELLEEDPVGVRQGAGLFGPARGAVLRSTEAIVRGGWDRRALLAMEAWSIARAVGEPDAVMARIRFRIRMKRCPILTAAVKNGRRIDSDRDEWVRRVTETHQVFGAAAGH